LFGRKKYPSIENRITEVRGVFLKGSLLPWLQSFQVGCDALSLFFKKGLRIELKIRAMARDIVKDGICKQKRPPLG
jgi:hypothetical protein